MKKKIILLFPFLLLASCASPQTYTLKEATDGYLEVSNITSISVSFSLWQCATWPWPYEDYSSLDVDYIKTNKDIQYDFFNETGAKNARAIYLHLQTTDEGYYRNSIHFVINTLDRYISPPANKPIIFNATP